MCLRLADVPGVAVAVNTALDAPVERVVADGQPRLRALRVAQTGNAPPRDGFAIEHQTAQGALAVVRAVLGVHERSHSRIETLPCVAARVCAGGSAGIDVECPLLRTAAGERDGCAEREGAHLH